MEQNKIKDLMVELNVIEAPLFNFTKKTVSHKADALMKSDMVSEDAKSVLVGIVKKNPDTEVEYKKWIDKRGKSKELIVVSTRETPKGAAMDIFFALIKKLMYDNYPIDFDENGGLNLAKNSTNFTLAELCRIMGVKPNKREYDKIREAIMQLRSVEYYSVGAIYNKEKKLFEDGMVESVGLVSRIRASTRNDVNEIIEGTVEFSPLVMDNLKAGYVRMLRNDVYFHIRTGISRALYIYVENNRGEIYTKRSFKVISDRIPIPYRIPYDLKRKLKQPLQNLIDAGVIADYLYGDEYKIGGVKEQCIYFIFKGTKSTLIKHLEEEYAKKIPKKLTAKDKAKDNLEQETELVFPENIRQELEGFGINDKKIVELMSKHSKYKLAEYILWLKDGIAKGKVKDSAGLFVFAITDGNVDVGNTHSHIIEFVARYKAEVEGKNLVSEEIIKNEYGKYIEQELKLFESEEEFAYIASVTAVIKDIEKVQERKIKSQRQLYNMATTDDEKAKLMATIEKWEKFSIEREKSEVFIEQFVKKTKLLRGLKDYEDFRREFIDRNK